jgi:uncharacterized membrane protein
LAIEQQTPGVPGIDRIDLNAPTEVELCSRGAVKLTHFQLADLKVTQRATLTELQAEKQLNGALTIRANASETELRVLKENIRLTGYREIIIRIVELIIVALLAYAIDFEKSGDTKDFVVFVVICLVLVILIALIQWAPRPRGNK